MATENDEKESLDRELSYGGDYKFIPAVSVANGKLTEVLPDLACLTLQIVNAVLVGRPGSRDFVLIDAGMPGSAERIIAAAEKRFGARCRPRAILLTHGHFDHVGALVELIDCWDVPVYAHELELPYLTGRTGYPEPDPTVEGGLIAKLSFLFPHEPIQLGEHVRPLPPDGTVPQLPDFRWLPTPGHSPGHVSFFRDRDRALVAGDAFTTVRQDRLLDAFTQHAEISGPPRYFTTDWQAAWNSVRKLEALRPSAAVTGHGSPLSGERLTEGLARLAEQFGEAAIPDYGKYVQ